ncbi:hypothetical protein HPP92_022640 [Vanilla planifolia]|uniref:Uncharacterized protein n=1 Tax=Vanilla planifolia TaxID=51239 RepID=A0A835PXV1_VANPL|nr:hypothetical protein HPP92_022640 [Vanilla planifolia]
MGGWEPKSESGQPAKIEEWDDERFVRGCLPDLLLHSSFPYPHPSAPQSSGLSLLPSFRAQTSCFKSKQGSSVEGSSQSSGSKDKELELLSKPSLSLYRTRLKNHRALLNLLNSTMPWARSSNSSSQGTSKRKTRFGKAGNENKLDVNVGADMLGTMLTKDVLPFYDGEMAYLCCDLGKDTKDFMVNGKMGLVKDELAMEGGKFRKASS